MKKKSNKKMGNESQETKNSFVPPFIASICSIFLPGLGQILARAYRRGLILFFSFITVTGLLIWRIFQAGRRYEDILTKISKAYYLEPTLILLTILIAIIYIWIIIDAFIIAKRSGISGEPAGLLFMVLIVFFILGWQIGEIDLIAFFSRADDAVPTITRVMWPWKKAIEYPKEIMTISAEIQSPCTEIPFPEAEPKEDEPFLLVEPTCGDTTEVDGTPGTTFSLTGSNYDPLVEVEIWWKDPLNNEFRQRQEGEYVKAITDENGDFNVDIIMPYRLMPPAAGEGEKIWEIQTRQIVSIGSAQPSKELKLAIEKMIETIFIGMMATFFGIIFAIPLSFLAAKNLMSEYTITKAIYYVIRTILNIVRSIEPLIWAIIAVIVVGLGPFAGILALSLHSMAALAKLYSEAIESIDPGPIEAIHATGANWVQTIAFAVVPQIVPPYVSFTIYRWDINIRMSTIIGFVGGGGIGFLLSQWIRLLDYRAAGIAVWFIAITVAILDYLSAEIREKFV
ncbi:MAG TPA: phosphonate ABC transporter, permease protein PhnE [Anaerolineae bacterium]|nr:phosphonate ABC transporter, permease protein PhnE [Anaerolineae bacterium]